MYKNKKVGVVVPAYNEEKLISRVITTMPEFVDLIIVIDDASQDRTAEIVTRLQDTCDKKIVLIKHPTNQGVGGAILSGHQRAVSENMDLMAVMAGDAQMDPADLPKILDPVVQGKADYSKGNRFISGEAWRHMPRLRYFANASLSMLNKIAIGYWHIADPQCGYTAISRETFESIDCSLLKKRYQFENSLLLALNINRKKVIDVSIRAIYGVGEKSGINHLGAFFAFSIYLLQSFFYRLKEKYIIRDFHPLVFFYLFSLVFGLIGFGLGTYLFVYRVLYGPVQATSALFATFLVTTGLQFLLFAMWFDKDYETKG